jgi:hypothetical protein
VQMAVEVLQGVARNSLTLVRVVDELRADVCQIGEVVRTMDDVRSVDERRRERRRGARADDASSDCAVVD